MSSRLNSSSFCKIINKKKWSTAILNWIWAIDNTFIICFNPVKQAFTGFKQLINFVSSSWFPAKSVEQMIVEQSNFEQFTPIRNCNLTFQIIFRSIWEYIHISIYTNWDSSWEKIKIYLLYFLRRKPDHKTNFKLVPNKV